MNINQDDILQAVLEDTDLQKLENSGMKIWKMARTFLDGSKRSETISRASIFIQTIPSTSEDPQPLAVPPCLPRLIQPARHWKHSLAAAVSVLMAIWRTWTRADGSQGLLYRNLVTSAEYRCGVLLSSTSQNTIVEWILRQDAAGPWDLISFETGAVFLVMPAGARA